jgi:hypothetical protein
VLCAEASEKPRTLGTHLYVNLCSPNVSRKDF